MITAHLEGLGACKFEVLPKAVDVIACRVGDEARQYEVVSLTHLIVEQDKPPLIYINVRQDAPAFRSDDVDEMFRGAE